MNPRKARRASLIAAADAVRLDGRLGAYGRPTSYRSGSDGRWWHIVYTGPTQSQRRIDRRPRVKTPAGWAP